MVGAVRSWSTQSTTIIGMPTKVGTQTSFNKNERGCSLPADHEREFPALCLDPGPSLDDGALLVLDPGSALRSGRDDTW